MTPLQKERVQLLLFRWLEGEATNTERGELSAMLKAHPEDEQWEELLEEIYYADNEDPVYKEEEWKEVLESILEKNRQFENGAMVYKFNWKKFAAAASILLVISLAAYFLFFSKQKEQADIVKTIPAKDVPAPATNKATITLADGRIIYLDSINNGTISTENNVTVIKTADGKIIYSGNADEVYYNTLHNPRGSKVIDMTLSDGSKVWLNAGSSVTYPIAFIGDERKVSITGEAYFEASPSPSEGGVFRPFIVQKGSMEVRVLGTHFNVNAYDDESTIKVTLLEGSVKVIQLTTNNSKLLKPGQQAIISNEIKLNDRVNVEEVVAWKNGIFKFNRTDLKLIMREVGRWYDAEIEYEGKIPEQLYSGEVPRSANLSQVLTALEYTGAHFRIEGKKIIVRP